MQKFIMLGIVAAAIVGLTTALAGNEINLTVQNLGVGEDSISSPIENAFVDFNVLKIESSDERGAFFKNVVDACSFHTDEGGDQNQDLPPGSEIICKLFGPTQDNEPGKPNERIIAEGKCLVGNLGYIGSQRILVPIQQPDTPPDVQEVKGVKLVVLGPAPTVPPGIPICAGTSD